MKSKFFLKAWSVDQKTIDEIQAGCDLLDTDNQSYTLRRLVALGREQLQKQKISEA